MLKALLFDFGGTLDADGLTWPDRFFLLYEQAGLPGGREAHTAAFYRADDTLAARFRLDGLGLEEVVRLQVGVALESLAPGAADGLRERLVRGFVDPARERLALNRPVLERLRRRFRLGIVSNFYGNLESMLRADGLAGLFDVVADSGKVGVMKPEPGIFLHALRALGARPEEAMMVGDSLRRDIRGAEALGMPHAWLTSSEESCCPQGVRLRRLPELETALAARAGV